MSKKLYDIGELIVDGTTVVVQSVFSLLLIVELLGYIFRSFRYGWFDAIEFIAGIFFIIVITAFEIKTLKVVVNRFKDLKNPLSAYELSKWSIISVIVMIVFYSLINYGPEPIHLVLVVMALAFQIPDFKFREKSAKAYLMEQIKILQSRLE